MTIGSSLTSIEGYLFYGCSSLTSITFPGSVTSIGSYAFNGCSSLTDVYYGGTESDRAGITIGSYNTPLTGATWHCAVATGTCGDDLTWVLDDEYTLTISGSGAMSDYSVDEAPWYASYQTSIKSIVIEDGVTSIGSGAFNGFYVTIVCGCSSYTAGWCEDNSVPVEVIHDLKCTAEAVAATCTTPGNSEYYTCADCGHFFTLTKATEQGAEDTWTEIEENGWIIPATGHTVVTDAAVAATCSATGLTEGKHCSVCNEVLVAQQTVEKLEHKYAFVDGKEATCTEDGYTDSYVCSACGDVLVAAETIQATGHTAQDIAAVEATCTTAGHTAGTVCSVCGATISGNETIEAKGHSWQIVPAQDATCTEAGHTRGVICARCSAYQLEPTVIPATGHTEVTDAAVAATCTETGLTEGKHCSVCGTVTTAQQTIPVTGHHLTNGVCVDCGSTVDTTGMTTLTLPASLKQIGADAFRGAAAQVVIVPDGCRSIASGAFTGCAELRYVFLPEGVTIAEDAFGAAVELIYR